MTKLSVIRHAVFEKCAMTQQVVRFICPCCIFDVLTSKISYRPHLEVGVWLTECFVTFNTGRQTNQRKRMTVIRRQLQRVHRMNSVDKQVVKGGSSLRDKFNDSS